MAKQPQNTKTDLKLVSKTQKKSTKKNKKILQKDDKNSIANIIKTFVHEIRDIEVAALIHIKYAFDRRKEKFQSLIKIIEEEEVKISKSKKESISTSSIMKIMQATENLTRLQNSRVPHMLELSLFLGLFSVYDNFTGELLTAIYSKKPELFKRVNYSISLSEILQFNSFDELKSLALQQEIEDFRRKSYIEQFEELEKTFDLRLKDFKRWTDFVECGQRRNLLTHAGGIVSKQYIKVCEKEKVPLSSTVKVGDKLKLGSEYFVSSCELLIEVGFKLGQVLWRKIFPEEVEKADDHLIETVFEDCLKMERWDRGQIFGEFAISLKSKSTDLHYKIFVVNYAISLKFGGKDKEAREILSKVDWSSSSNDFKLSEAVLCEKYDKASEIMKRIGKESDIISEEAYHQFPLFKEFRKSKQFLDTYEEIYEQSFADKVQKDADKQTEEVESKKLKILKADNENEQSF